MSDLRIETVARAMAKAVAGYEEYPPSLAMPGQMMSGSTGMFYSGDPAWKKYVTEARKFIAAFDVMSAG
jgi:hypothetical protein